MSSLSTEVGQASISGELEGKPCRRKWRKEGRERTQREALGVVDGQVMGWQEGQRLQRGMGRPEISSCTLNVVADKRGVIVSHGDLLCKASLPQPQREATCFLMLSLGARKLAS